MTIALGLVAKGSAVGKGVSTLFTGGAGMVEANADPNKDNRDPNKIFDAQWNIGLGTAATTAGLFEVYKKVDSGGYPAWKKAMAKSGNEANQFLGDAGILPFQGEDVDNPLWILDTGLFILTLLDYMCGQGAANKGEEFSSSSQWQDVLDKLDSKELSISSWEGAGAEAFHAQLASLTSYCSQMKTHDSRAKSNIVELYQPIMTCHNIVQTSTYSTSLVAEPTALSLFGYFPPLSYAFQLSWVGAMLGTMSAYMEKAGHHSISLAGKLTQSELLYNDVHGDAMKMSGEIGTDSYPY